MTEIYTALPKEFENLNLPLQLQGQLAQVLEDLQQITELQQYIQQLNSLIQKYEQELDYIKFFITKQIFLKLQSELLIQTSILDEIFTENFKNQLIQFITNYQQLLEKHQNTEIDELDQESFLSSFPFEEIQNFELIGNNPEQWQKFIQFLENTTSIEEIIQAIPNSEFQETITPIITDINSAIQEITTEKETIQTNLKKLEQIQKLILNY